MFQTKVVEKIKTHIWCQWLFFSNVEKSTGRPQMTIWRMRIACWITEATNTHPEYVILISFPLQQWLYERASMLSYTSTAYVLSPNREVAVWSSQRSALCSLWGMDWNSILYTIVLRMFKSDYSVAYVYRRFTVVFASSNLSDNTDFLSLCLLCVV